MRVGIGYDFHRLARDRKLVLGGVEIPHDKGLQGHSDGDVLTHAICDALLGAASLGDIGTHFPSSDPRYKNVSSILLLDKVNKLLQESDYQIINIDTIMVTEEPKLQPFYGSITKLIAKTLNIQEHCVSVKAKTEEGVGPTGRGEGIAAHAIALIERVSSFKSHV